MMVRLPDWPERLAAVMHAARRRAFAWGPSDCVTFAADAVLACTGQDPLDGLRGRWASEDEAAAVLASMGGFEAAVSSRLGAPLAQPAGMWRGDIAMLHTPAGPALAVCGGDHFMAPGKVGLAWVPAYDNSGRVAAQRVWGVGHA